MSHTNTIANGSLRFKTKLDVIKAAAIGLALTLPAVVLMTAGSVSALHNSYTLFGSATATTEGNPGSAVQLGSVGFETYSGIDYEVAADTTFSEITNLSTDYKVTVGDCAGGSPRFQVNIADKNVFVYIGPSPNFTGCAVNTWVSTGNLTTSPDARFDTSQFTGGNVYSTYADAVALLGNQVVTGVQLVVDAGWAIPDGTQTILADNTAINATTYTYEPAVTPTKDSCKKNGWKTMNNPGPFKNQGDCVSYFASSKNNRP